MTLPKLAYDRTQLNPALEISIHIGLAILLATACLLILRPFIPLLTWGIIIGVAAYSGFQKLKLALGGRGVVTAILLTVLLSVGFAGLFQLSCSREHSSRVSRPLQPTSRKEP